MLLHHGTRQADGLPPFARFGTRRAARAGLVGVECDQDRIISAWLDIRNPLHVPGLGGATCLSEILDRISSVAPGLIGPDRSGLACADPNLILAALSTRLQEGGFDGLVFEDHRGGPDATGWVALDPSQVHVYRDGPAAQTRDPWEIDEQEWIGPAIVLDIFEIDGRSEEFAHLFESLEEEGADLPVLLRDAQGWSVRWIDDWEPEGTVGLFDPGGSPRGFYMGGMVWVDPEARGAGRSSLMILAAADLLGEAPSRNRAGLGYSPAGHAAHLSALRKARDLQHRPERGAPEAGSAGIMENPEAGP